MENEITVEKDKGGQLALLLRSLGTLAIIAAAICFLAQRWEDMQHLTRYFSFLGFTSLLGMLGVFCGIKIKEAKSARTLLALSGGLVVINTAQLAALIFSYFNSKASLIAYPDFLLWKAASLGECLTAMGIGIPVLLIIMMASFSVLAREIRFKLISTAALLNLALLLPYREPNITGTIILAMVIVLAITYKNIRQSTVLRTFEGRIAQAHLLLPLVLIISRVTYLYSATAMLISLLSISTSIVLFSVLPQLFEQNSVKMILQKISIFTVCVGCCFFAISVSDTYQLSSRLFIPLCAIPAVTSLLLMSFKAVGGGQTERRVAVLVSFTALILQIFIFPGVLSFGIGLLFSIIVSAYGSLTENKSLFFYGIAAFAVSLLAHFKHAIVLGMINPWISLALLGTLTILGAAFAEKHFCKITEYYSSLKNRYVNN